MLWSIPRDDDPAAFKTASKLALYMSEYGAGHRSEDDLRQLFDQYSSLPPGREIASTTFRSLIEPNKPFGSAIAGAQIVIQKPYTTYDFAHLHHP
jgi:hypothetical protein